MSPKYSVLIRSVESELSVGSVRSEKKISAKKFMSRRNWSASAFTIVTRGHEYLDMLERASAVYENTLFVSSNFVPMRSCWFIEVKVVELLIFDPQMVFSHPSFDLELFEWSKVSPMANLKTELLPIVSREASSAVLCSASTFDFVLRIKIKCRIVITEFIFVRRNVFANNPGGSA